jgi:hypothetical protein
MSKWEIKRLWVPLDLQVHSNTSKQHTYYNPVWNDDTKKAWAQAEALAAEGWELVSALPETGAHELTFESGVKALGAGSSYTVGYLLFFKRAKV